MAHGIAVIDGKDAMAYNAKGGTPWHKLGTALPDAVSGEEMQVAAGLNWEVEKRPLHIEGLDGILRPVEGWEATTRSTDNAQLGIVHSTYQPIQNREIFDFADSLLATGQVKFETAGALNGGRTVWALALAEGLIRIEGDPSPIEPYLLISTGHDALRAMRVDLQPVRVVCQNTLNVAIKGSPRSFVIRHTKNAMDKVLEARKALRVNVDYMAQFEAVAKDLMSRPLSIADVKRFTEVLLPSASEDKDKETRTDRQRDAITALFANSNTLEGVGFNSYRAVQAVAEWADHERGFRATKMGSAEDARALAILDGTATDIKDRALALLLGPTSRGAVPFARSAKV